MSDVCLKCTLPICDESLPGCAFVQIRRQERQPYFAAYYRYYKSDKIEAAKDRHERLKNDEEYQRQRRATARLHRQTEEYKAKNRERCRARRVAAKRENSVAK